MTCSNQNCLFRYTDFEDDPQSCPDREVQCRIADTSREVEFHKGEALFLEGQPSSSLYSLTSGMVKICRDVHDHEIAIAAKGEGRSASTKMIL